MPGATPISQLATWRSGVPSVTSLDLRLPTAVHQALVDLAALRIVDEAHPDRPVVAAGAPWFMTLFGRDSLLTSWMTLPFDASLAGGARRELVEESEFRRELESGKPSRAALPLPTAEPQHQPAPHADPLSRTA